MYGLLKIKTVKKYKRCPYPQSILSYLIFYVYTAQTIPYRFNTYWYQIYSIYLNDMLEAGLEELLPHEGNLRIVSRHPAEYFLSFIFKIFILDAVGGKQA